MRIAGAGVWQWNMRDNEWTWIENIFQPAGSSLRYSVAVGEEFYRHVHPDHRDRLLKVETLCRQGHPSMFDDYRYRLESGEERWLRDIGHIVSGGPGDPPIMIGITLDITGEKLRAIEEEQRSLSDDLTGLPNRRALTEALDGLAAGGRAFCLGFVDLNGFKPLNDRHGHAAATAASRCSAQRSALKRDRRKSLPGSAATSSSSSCRCTRATRQVPSSASGASSVMA